MTKAGKTKPGRKVHVLVSSHQCDTHQSLLRSSSPEKLPPSDWSEGRMLVGSID